MAFPNTLSQAAPPVAIEEMASLTPGALHQFQLSTDGRISIAYASPRYFEIFNISPDDAARGGGSLFGKVPAEDARRLRSRIAESAKALSVFDEEWRILLEDGERWVHSTSTPRRMPDGSIVWCGYTRDVTHFKIMQAKLKASEAERAAQEVKSTILGNMTHELRTPLNAIIGFNELAIEDLADCTNPDQTIDDLRNAVRAAHHMLHLIENLLAFGGQASAANANDGTAFDVAEVIADAHKAVTQSSKQSPVQIHTEIQADLDPVSVDRGMLNTCLVNLISNANKFARTSVWISASMVENSTGPMIEIKVRDDGVGIETGKLHTIFEPLRSEDVGLTKSSAGIGIGLCICRETARSMGGELVLESLPGKGTIAKLLIPRKAPGRAPALPDAPERLTA